MNISLKHFLRTGYLGGVSLGASSDKIKTLLGPPDNFAKSFRKARLPDVWLYGGVEVWFDQSLPQICRGLWIECSGHGWRDEFKMPVGSAVEDWDLKPYLPREKMQDYLQQNCITASQTKPIKTGKKGYIFAPRELVVPASSTALIFDEEWQLSAFSARQSD